ncbi:hypothetical protein ACFO4O_11755 [Glaciecola siphonariae]|uniref:Uncharacterized protein n=1 Tax=Glaciecola siphonariae TaxID=521012 RepID=A0ABV9LWE1_9ALTE
MTTNILSKLGLFREIPNSQFWFMGLVGLFSVGVKALVDIQYGNVVGKMLEGLMPFVYFPFLLIFKSQQNKLSTILNLLLFTLILIVFGIMQNSRGTFSEAIVIVLFVGLLYSLYNWRVVLSNLKPILLFGFFGLILFAILSDLAKVMVIVRPQREHIAGIDLILLTIETWMNRELLDAYSQSMAMDTSRDYNEVYISNPMLGRLITTKFEDNLILYSTKLNFEESIIVLNATIEKTIALLPTPVLNLFTTSISKVELEYSISDLAWYLQRGSGLGTYRVSPPLGHGLILFGHYFFFVSIFVLPIVYTLVDSFCKVTKKNTYFASIFLILIYELYKLFSVGSLIGPIEFFARTIPQLILFYIVFSLIFKVRYRAF